MALLILPGPENAQVVTRDANKFASLLGCKSIELWPYAYQLDTIRGKSGKKYRFQVWVDEEGLVAGRPPNICASLAAHPLNEAWGHVIAGPAVLLPLGDVSYTLADWSDICQGVWYDDRTVELNAKGPLATIRGAH